MKKLLLFIIAVSVFSPCSVPAADGAVNTEKPFQIAKAYKLGQEKESIYIHKDVTLKTHEPVVCPSGQYRVETGCRSLCQGITCTKGTEPVLAHDGKGCCCY
ncbi:MAG: hypothetical protein IKR09_01735 [Alphaproteobacteria bacterium]|nr:hypothetical protein [Alphaproteobacteria bacterium]